MATAKQEARLVETRLRAVEARLRAVSYLLTSAEGLQDQRDGARLLRCLLEVEEVRRERRVRLVI